MALSQRNGLLVSDGMVQRFYDFWLENGYPFVHP